MSSVADRVESERAVILRGVHAQLGNEALRALADHALRELVRSLREPDAGCLTFAGPIGVETLRRTLHVLRARVLDVIEPHVSARELRLVVDWFSTATERALGDDNRRLVAMLDALDDHVILLDPETRLMFLNRASEPAARAQGFSGSREELIGKSVIEDSQALEHKQYISGLVARARKGETVSDEFLLAMPEGAVWHEHHIHPVYTPAGELEAIAIASRDIHARKQAEGRLLLLSKMGLLAETSDFDGVLAQAAGIAIPELADWSVFELLADGQVRCGRIVHPDADRAALAEQRLRESRGCTLRPIGDVELGARIYRLGPIDDGTLRASDPALHAVLQQFGATTAIVVPFIVMGAPIAIATFVFGPESGRQHSSADLAIADEVARRAAQIVENARLHAEVAQALAYRERVIGILSHDLRNPVAAVLSLSSTLAQRRDVPDRTKEGLRHIRQAAERMDQMISTLLDFTQLRFRGTPALALETFDLGGLARTIVDELRVANPTRHITLAASGELRGRWDPSRMGQLISNLIGNALTHGARESPVTVTLASDKDRVVIAVMNRGPTIPAEALDKLFEPFWQGPHDGANKPRGLGLGLFIAQQIVQAHHGEIALQSRDDQTTFTVRLPR